MHEHRLIERMIALIDLEAKRLRAGAPLEPDFIHAVTDFIRTYADRCHHGKEEDILFRDLAGRDLAPDLKRIMDELVQEHKYGRAVVKRLVGANDRHQQGDAAAREDVLDCLESLGGFYPTHIEKEDKHFFFPCMELFDQRQKEAMLAEFWEFDRKLIHESYKAVVETWQKNKGG